MRSAPLSAAPFSLSKVPQFAERANFLSGSNVGTPARANAMETPVLALRTRRRRWSTLTLRVARSLDEASPRLVKGTEPRLPKPSVVTTLVAPDCAALLAGKGKPGIE